MATTVKVTLWPTTENWLMGWVVMTTAAGVGLTERVAGVEVAEPAGLVATTA